jgi:ribosomal protein L7/L12
MSDAPSVSSSRCMFCGASLQVGARFCNECGRPQAVPSQQAVTPTAPPAQSPPIGSPPKAAGARVAAEPVSALPVSTPVQPATAGYRVKLMDAGAYKGQVLLALRQQLQLDAPTAGRFVAAAPIELAVGLSEEKAESLRATLVGAGAAVHVQAPPEEPRPAAAPKPPKPEPVRSMAEMASQIRWTAARRGPRTLTGLALGRGGSYLAYGRVEGSRLLSPPDFIRVDTWTMIPTAVRLAGSGTTEVCGNRALQSWVQNPTEVSLGFTEELGLDDGAALPAARAFLKLLNYRLVEVLGPGAADPGEGAATSVGVSSGRTPSVARLLAEVAEQAGFPVVQLVPEPVAAVASTLSQNAGQRPSQAQYYLVIDWGSQGLDLSTVENAPNASGPIVIDHVEYPLGGIWLDMILGGWLTERLPGELSDEDRRALTLFARLFKENASTSFADGRSEHVQYCVLPVGLPPTRISIKSGEMEELFRDARAQFQAAVEESPGRVGFKPDHFDEVVMVGGAANCYFVRDAVRKALGRAPVVAAKPEEAIARGLVFWGAR